MWALPLRGWRRDLRQLSKTTTENRWSYKSRARYCWKGELLSCFVLLCLLNSGFLDHAAELTDPHAAWRFNSWRQTENYDCLHHWCPCSRRGRQSHKSEGKTFVEWGVMQARKPTWWCCCMCLLGDNRPGLCMAVSITPSLGWRNQTLLH